MEALTVGEIDGALLDTLMAREFQKDLLNYKFQGMIEHDFAYGLVLARDGLKLEKMFMNFLKYQQSAIYSILSNAVVEEEIVRYPFVFLYSSSFCLFNASFKLNLI